MTPASGAALMWLVRNRLVLDLGLDQRDDVHLVSLRRVPRRPGADHAPAVRASWTSRTTPRWSRHVTARPPTHREPLDIDPLIRDRCATTSPAKLDAAAGALHARRA